MRDKFNALLNAAAAVKTRLLLIAAGVACAFMVSAAITPSPKSPVMSENIVKMAVGSEADDVRWRRKFDIVHRDGCTGCGDLMVTCDGVCAAYYLDILDPGGVRYVIPGNPYPGCCESHIKSDTEACLYC